MKKVLFVVMMVVVVVCVSGYMGYRFIPVAVADDGGGE